jgi:hypothetical protein
MALSTGKLEFKPRKTSAEIKPDAPPGEWTALIPKGKCKVKKTAKDDPMLVIPFKLKEAHDEKNESHQGSEVTMMVVIFDDSDSERLRASNMMKGRLRGLCEALDLDFADLYPDGEISSSAAFDKLFAAIEGQELRIWTLNSTRKGANGDDITDTEIRFKAPGSGLSTPKESDEEEKPKSRNGTTRKASSRK